jgi:hypothetical protein
MNPFRSRRALGVFAAVAVTTSILVVLLARTSAIDPTTAAVHALVQRALRAEHELATLPAGISVSEINGTAKAALVSHAEDELGQVFAGDILAPRRDAIIGAINAEGTDDGLFFWGGGVRNVTFLSTVIEGDSASVHLQATSFLVMSQRIDGPRDRPENRADYKFTLSKTPDGWRVTEEAMRFLPGEGP